MLVRLCFGEFIRQPCVSVLWQFQLHLTKRPAHWVTCHLGQAQKDHRKKIVEDFNDKLIDDVTILDWIVTCDESWFLCYDPSSRQSMSSWLPKNATHLQKPRLDRYALKIIR